jgi:two-component system, response regulator PdtaR
MAKVKILVVEDERTMAADVINRLRTLGYTSSETAFSGEEALIKASENPPDLVLVDIQLKGEMDSLRTAREIQDGFDIPVVYLADYIDNSTLLQAKVTEPYEYILKPFIESELRMNIEAALYKHKMAVLRRFVTNES